LIVLKNATHGSFSGAESGIKHVNVELILGVLL